ncbi:MAG: sulfur carrier protein ThiS [Opitutae bacterium]|jgi:sulfur carrier protein|nr:sulfur carrier protein ThiS [Opitutae bacterium]
MNILVNDESKNVPAGSSLRSLLVELGMIEFNGWAIAVNNEVVPVDAIDDLTLSPNDQIMLVQATQGG